MRPGNGEQSGVVHPAPEREQRAPISGPRRVALALIVLSGRAVPLLIVLSSLIGFILSSQTGTYLKLVNYPAQVMPRSAFAILTGMLGQITSGASSGKLSSGVRVSLWTASSGVAALIEALNVAFEVPISRSWLRRRLIAIALTLGIGLLLMASLVLDALGRLSGVVRWLRLYASAAAILLGGELNAIIWRTCGGDA